MEPDLEAVSVEVIEGEDGQVLAGVDDLLVLLRRIAQSWVGEEPDFLEKFNHVVEGAMASV